MAQTVGNLSVFLSLNATGFSKGIDSARKHLSQFSKDFGSIRNLVAGGLGAVGIALTARAFQAMVAEQMKAIDATAKLSDSLGTTTENLQAFRDAASMSGAEAPDQLLSQLTKKIGEARQGSAEAAKVFATLGLSVDQLANMDTVTAFGEVSKAINGLATAADRGAVAAKIFGDQGTKLGPLFQSGAEGIAAAKAQAELLGTSLSRIDAARVELAGDAIARIQQASNGLQQQITIALAPAIQHAADLMLGWLSQAGGSQSVVNTGFEKMARILGVVADASNFLLSLFNSIKFAVGGIGLAIGSGLYLQLAAVAKIGQGLLIVLEKSAGAAASLAELTPGGDGVAKRLREAQASLRQGAVYASATEAFGRGLLTGFAEEVGNAGGMALDAWDRGMAGSGSKAVEGFIDAARAKSDAMAAAIVAGLPKGIAEAAAVAAPEIANTIGTAMVDGAAEAAMADGGAEIFSPGRLGAATYGSVEGFRASAGLQNQPMLTLQRESVRIEKEQRDLLTEIRDQNADTVTVSL